MTRFKDGRYYGVLNDWDLASRTDFDYPRKDLTATIPYIALHLLAVGSTNPEVKRLYYYELESFFWSMIWMFLAHQDKKLRPTPKVAHWPTGNPLRSCEIRAAFLAFPKTYQPHDEWKPYWQMGITASEWVYSRYNYPNQEETTAGNWESLQIFLALVGQVFMDPMPTTPAIDVV